MLSKIGIRPSNRLLQLALIAVGCLQSQITVSAQNPLPSSVPAVTPKSDTVPVPVSTVNPSQVFPNRNILNTPPSPPANIPVVSMNSVQGQGGGLQPAPLPSADYAQPGIPRDGQTVPGLDYYRYKDDYLPFYYYQPNYYERADVGARPFADYAPLGFEAREFQDAPGAPEFTRLAVPPQITEEERQKFVTRGMMPGSFLVPGTNTSFRIRGFIRGTAIYDFQPIGSRDDFVTNTIPVPQENGENFNYTARPSRFAIETWTPTTFKDWNVHTFIEGDFFNGPAQAVGGGGNPFRLRFAFADFGYFRIGQQNTVFMDSNAWPSTVDFAGPRGLLNQRRPGARVTIPISESFFWAAGVEQPFSDITTNGQGTAFQDVPDLATHIRYESDYGHAQISGLARSIGYQPNGGDRTSQTGWGLSGSTVFHPWAILSGCNPVRQDNPSGLERSRILLQYNLGQGFGRYIQDTAGLGFDGQVNPITGEFKTVYATSWSTSYEHWYSEKWLTNITYTKVDVNNTEGQAGDTYASASYLATSLWFIPVRNFSIGVEYVWGERENLDGQRAKANRINGLFQYNF